MLGIVRAADGWIGINCLTGQHWLDVCAMVGLPEFGEHQIAIMLGGPERDEFFAKAQPWLDSINVADLVELSQAMRIPAAPINDGASILNSPQYSERGFFIEGGPEGARFQRPGAPFRLSQTPVADRGPHRGSGEDNRGLDRARRGARDIRNRRRRTAIRWVEGLRPEYILGGRVSHLLSGRLRGRRHQGRVDSARRWVPLCGRDASQQRRLVRNRADVPGRQPQQA